MKIEYKSIKYLLGTSYLLLLLIGGIIIGIVHIYQLFDAHFINCELIITFIYTISCLTISWYIYTLLKCNFYIIELYDNKFRYKTMLNKEYMYSEIKDIYIVELKTKGESNFHILIIKMKAKAIRLRIDKLSNKELDGLLDLIKMKTKFKFIITKNKSDKLFPMI